ncbi:MAG: response regulator transcription factor [Oligoflexales bacterium]|nr:response regulator transcription factor [Oligoflexales bacterium]
MGKKKLIWVVEDDAAVNETLCEILDKNFLVESFDGLSSFYKAMLLKENGKPDLVLVDNCHPDGRFSDFVLTERFDRISMPPFILLTGQDDAKAISLCYEKGGVDYIRKPFNEFELLVKIKHHIDKLENEAVEGQFQLDNNSLTICKNAVRSPILTAKEFQILSILFESKGQSASKAKLVSSVWNNIKVSDKSIRVHLSNLRRKIRPLGLSIEYKNSLYKIIDKGDSFFELDSEEGGR